MQRRRTLVLIPAFLAVFLAMAPQEATLAQPVVPNEAILRLFLDKNGGYKDKDGGYYNPKAGTYTDKEGGVVDNWKGYTYADGSYKLDGNYYDAKKKTVFFAGPEKESQKVDGPAAEVIKAMRDTAAENGEFDKDFVRKSMFAAIKAEHVQPAPGGR